MQEASPLLFVWVFSGGALGSIARELLLPFLSSLGPPWVATLVVNVVASFVMGWLYGASDRLHHHLLQFAAVGFCGGFSTFSHFADQVYAQVSGGDWAPACANVVSAVILGVAAAYVGDRLGGASRDRA